MAYVQVMRRSHCRFLMRWLQVVRSLYLSVYSIASTTAVRVVFMLLLHEGDVRLLCMAFLCQVLRWMVFCEPTAGFHTLDHDCIPATLPQPF